MIAILLGCGLRRAKLAVCAEKTYKSDNAIGRSLILLARQPRSDRPMPARVKCHGQMTQSCFRHNRTSVQGSQSSWNRLG